MHFDDRLDTVLRQPVRGREIARVQYVQLLDLLGKTSADTASASLDPAYARLSALAGELPAGERARLLRDSGLKLRNPALVAFLAEGEADVASAAINAAELDEKQWLDLVPALPVQSRGVLRHRPILAPLSSRGWNGLAWPTAAFPQHRSRKSRKWPRYHRRPPNRLPPSPGQRANRRLANWSAGSSAIASPGPILLPRWRPMRRGCRLAITTSCRRRGFIASISSPTPPGA
jgi:hypothetical protein